MIQDLLSCLPSVMRVIQDFHLLADSRYSKSLGQHFLIDPNILRKVVAAAGPLEEATVLEIGPGPGGLTREILRQKPQHLIAIEKDPRCCLALQSLVESSQGRLILRQENALKIFPLSPIVSDFKKPLKIIANLPYNVGTPILLNLLQDPYPIHSMVLMFQKEVADRILAVPGQQAYGRLSIIVQYLAKIERVFTLSPQAFIPPPKISSTVLLLTPSSNTDRTVLQNLARLTQTAFQSRRKMLRHSLKNLWPSEILEGLLESLCISPEQRPETLSISDFITLAQQI